MALGYPMFQPQELNNRKKGSLTAMRYPMISNFG